jgi:hypothetical protein
VTCPLSRTGRSVLRFGSSVLVEIWFFKNWNRNSKIKKPEPTSSVLGSSVRFSVLRFGSSVLTEL